MEEGDVHFRGHGAAAVHDVQKQSGHSQLQHKLLDGGQALVLLLLHLGEVVQEAHKAEAKGQDQHIKHAVIIHKGQIAQQYNDGSADEHKAAHLSCMVHPDSPYVQIRYSSKIPARNFSAVCRISAISG